MLHNNDSITEDSNTAEVFNAYFSSVFTVDDGSDIAMLRESLSIHTSIIESINFTAKDVYKELISLQCDKACGPDLLPSRLLKLGAEFIAPSLAQLFQLSLLPGKLPSDWIDGYHQTGSMATIRLGRWLPSDWVDGYHQTGSMATIRLGRWLPSDWVDANVVPVHRKGDEHIASNYHPISLTFVIVKIMERIIHPNLLLLLSSTIFLMTVSLVYSTNDQLFYYFRKQFMIGPSLLNTITVLTVYS